MRKLDLLRSWMIAALPFLKRDPGLLQLFADEGRIACTGQGGSLSFEWRYAITMQLWDFAGDRTHVIVPLLAWIARHQPELLQSYGTNASAIATRAEVLDDAKIDLELKFEVSEAVEVIRRDDGSGCDVRPILEPSEDPGGLRTWTIWVQGEKVAEFQAHDDAFHL